MAIYFRGFDNFGGVRPIRADIGSHLSMDIPRLTSIVGNVFMPDVAATGVSPLGRFLPRSRAVPALASIALSCITNGIAQAQAVRAGQTDAGSAVGHFFGMLAVETVSLGFAYMGARVGGSVGGQIGMHVGGALGAGLIEGFYQLIDERFNPWRFASHLGLALASSMVNLPYAQRLATTFLGASRAIPTAAYWGHLGPSIAHGVWNAGLGLPSMILNGLGDPRDLSPEMLLLNMGKSFVLGALMTHAGTQLPMPTPGARPEVRTRANRSAAQASAGSSGRDNRQAGPERAPLRVRLAPAEAGRGPTSTASRPETVQPASAMPRRVTIIGQAPPQQLPPVSRAPTNAPNRISPGNDMSLEVRKELSRLQPGQAVYVDAGMSSANSGYQTLLPVTIRQSNGEIRLISAVRGESARVYEMPQRGLLIHDQGTKGLFVTPLQRDIFRWNPRSQQIELLGMYAHGKPAMHQLHPDSELFLGDPRKASSIYYRALAPEVKK